MAIDEQCEGGMVPAENGKSAAEWCSLHAQSSLRLAKAEALLRRAYEARQKWHWEGQPS